MCWLVLKCFSYGTSVILEWCFTVVSVLSGFKLIKCPKIAPFIWLQNWPYILLVHGFDSQEHLVVFFCLHSVKLVIVGYYMVMAVKGYLHETPPPPPLSSRPCTSGVITGTMLQVKWLLRNNCYQQRTILQYHQTSNCGRQSIQWCFQMNFFLCWPNPKLMLSLHICSMVGFVLNSRLRISDYWVGWQLKGFAGCVKSNSTFDRPKSTQGTKILVHRNGKLLFLSIWSS